MILGIITARMNSRRLPGKVMKDLGGKSVFAHHVERLRAVRGLNGIYLATSSEGDINQPLIEEAKRLGVPYYEGANEDVLERHEKIILQTDAAAIVRITCDMPLFDIETIERYIKTFINDRPDYIYPSNFNLLSGTMCELFSAHAIRKSHIHYKGPAIAMYIIEHPDEFKMQAVEARYDICRNDVRLDLDYPEDLELLRNIYNQLYKGKPIVLEEAYKFLDDNPNLIKINQWRMYNESAYYAHNLLYKPIFQINKSGNAFVILGENGKLVEVKDFLEWIHKMFPATERRILGARKPRDKKKK